MIDKEGRFAGTDLAKTIVKQNKPVMQKFGGLGRRDAFQE
jgi:hypothetical protein